MAEEQVSLEANLSPEEQSALARARGTTEQYVDSKYNDDGSPKEEQIEIPEKFKGKSLEDVVKAYTELEKKLSEKNTSSEPPQEENKKDTSEKEQSNSEVEDKVNAILSPKDFKKYEEAYLSQGALTDEHYKELEGKGFSKEIVDLYIEGAKAREQLYTQQIYNVAGGEEAYNELITWASQNLDQSTAQRLNEDLMSGSVERAKFAVETLQLRKGTPPRRVEGNSAASGDIKAYRSKTEWQKDVRDPNYGKDKKFTAMVDAKFLASKKKGTI